MPIDNTNEDLILSDIALGAKEWNMESEQFGSNIQEQQTEPEITTDDLVICAFEKCTELDVVQCRKCQRPFCIMHANKFSPNFCKDCFSNLASLEDKFTRTFEDFDTKADKLIVTRESCTRYYMDGPDWPFLQLWIDSLEDNQLRAIWNFHFFVMKTIEAENEVRKIKKLKKIRETPVDKTLKTSKATKMKSVVTKTVQIDTADDLRKRFKKQGLPDAVVEQMIIAMGVK